MAICGVRLRSSSIRLCAWTSRRRSTCRSQAHRRRRCRVRSCSYAQTGTCPYHRKVRVTYMFKMSYSEWSFTCSASCSFWAGTRWAILSTTTSAFGRPSSSSSRATTETPTSTATASATSDGDGGDGASCRASCLPCLEAATESGFSCLRRLSRLVVLPRLLLLLLLLRRRGWGSRSPGRRRTASSWETEPCKCKMPFIQRPTLYSSFLKSNEMIRISDQEKRAK